MSKECRKFYKDFFNIDKPYKHQERAWEIINTNIFPVLLKAPTGSGKTEAVVAPFLAQFTDNELTIAPRMIYILPMRVLVNSIAERIKGYAEKISLAISAEIQHGDLPDSPFFIANITSIYSHSHKNI